MRLEYLKKWKKSLYNDLLLSGKLQQHLLDIDRDAREEFESIVRQTAKAEGVTEELKKQDQMEWVGQTLKPQYCKSGKEALYAKA